MRKYVALGALVLGMPACGLLGNECGRANPATYYDVQGVEAFATRQPMDQPWTVVAPNGTVASREFRLRIGLKERHYTSVPASGLISAAYACSPVPAGSLGSAERMDSLSITSLYNYDAQHPAGTPLTDLLELRGQSQFPAPSRRNPSEPFRFAEISLLFPPATTGPQQFGSITARQMGRFTPPKPT